MFDKYITENNVMTRYLGYFSNANYTNISISALIKIDYFVLNAEIFLLERSKNNCQLC